MRSFVETTNKDEVLKTAISTFKAIEEEILPTFKLLLENKNIRVVKDSAVLRNINGYGKLGASNNAELIEIMYTRFQVYLAKKNIILDLIGEELSDNILASSINAKDMTITKIVEDITFITLYILDLLDYVFTQGGDQAYPPFKYREIVTKAMSFSMVLSYYTKTQLNQLVDAIPDMEDTKVNVITGKSSMIGIAFKDAMRKLHGMPGVTGFVGNPIYSIRMWLVDKEIAKYQVLKSKRKLLEARLLEAKLAEQSSPNDKEKAKQREVIEYYTGEIVDIESKIERTERKYQ